MGRALPCLELLEDRTVPVGDLVGDTLATARPVAFTRDTPVRFAEVVDSADDVDLYALNLTAGDVLTADVDAQSLGSPLDSYLRLFDAQGNRLAFNDDSDGLDSTLVFAIAANGTYFVGLSTFDNRNYNPLVAGVGTGGGAGNYELSLLVERPPPDGNDTLATAEVVVVTPGAPFSVSAAIALQGDVDLYSVTVPAGVVLTAAIAADAIGSNLDSYLRLFRVGAGGAVTEVAFNDDFNETDSVAGVFAAEAGTYLVGVSSFPNTAYDPTVAGSGSGRSFGRYDLVISTFTQPPDDNDTLQTADSVTLAAGAEISLTASVLYDRDVDLYAVAVPAGHVLDVNVIAEDVLDGHLRIFDAAGVEIAYNQGLLEQRLLALVDSVFFVGVSGGDNETYDPTQPFNGVGNSAGPYELVLRSERFQPDANDKLATAQPLTFIPNAVSTALGVVDHHRDVDFFSFDLQSGATVVLRVEADVFNSPLDSFLRIFDASGSDIVPANDDLNGDTLDSALEFTAPTAGRYFIGLSSFTLGVDYDPFDALNGDRVASSVGYYQLRYQVIPRVPDTAETLAPGASASGTLDGAGDTQVYGLVLTDPGLLSVRVDGLSGFAPRLTLSGPEAVLLSSEEAAFSQHLPRGAYFLTVSAEHAGSFELTSTFTPVTPPFQGVPVGLDPEGIVTEDFDGDGILDLATADYDSDTVSILLGVGDGTFRSGQRLAVGDEPETLTVADLNGDGNFDLAVTGDRVALLFGAGNGAFAEAVFVATSIFTTGIGAADFDEDGWRDLIVCSSFGDAVVLLPNLGGGTFGPEVPLLSGVDARKLIVADLDDDARPDVATVNAASVTLLRGQGDGTFSHVTLASPVLNDLKAIVTGRFDGDDLLDLAVMGESPTPGGNDGVTLFLNRDQAGFAVGGTFATGVAPLGMTAGDFNADGFDDLATADSNSNYVSVLLTCGDGTFQPALATGFLSFPSSVVSGDFNRDGRVDLAVGDSTGTSDEVGGLLGTGSDAVFFLPGRGDGSFQTDSRPRTGGVPRFIATGDFNRDGAADLVTANTIAGDSSLGNLSVLLANGDGTFQPQRILDNRGFPVGVAVGDFNGDGRDDLASVSNESGEVSVFLGFGDGTFNAPQRLAVGEEPVALATADLDGDGDLDLAVVNASEIRVLLGNRRGVFRQGPTRSVGEGLSSLTLGDFTGDNVLDVAAADRDANVVWLLRGRGDGTFRAPASFTVGTAPAFVVSGHFDADARLDLVALNEESNDASLLLGNGAGGFAEQRRFAAGERPQAVTVGDFDGDGLADLAVACFDTRTGNFVSILRGDGAGNFAPPRDVGNGSELVLLSIVAADFNTDGRPDLAAVDLQFDSVLVLLGAGAGTFVDPSDAFINEFRTEPLCADLDADGTTDLVALTRAGDILFRAGLPGEPGRFAAPRPLNDGEPARAIALVVDAVGTRLAALPTQGPRVILYTGDGFFSRLVGPPLGAQPVSLASADLDADGWGDLVVTDAATETVAIFSGQPDGLFALNARVPLRGGPALVSLVDLDAVNGLDVVVLNQVAGTVSVLLNDGANGFTQETTYRATPDLAGIDNRDRVPGRRSRDRLGAIVAGPFVAGGAADVVVVSSAANRFTLLESTARGGLVNPDSASSWRTGSRPTSVVTADFDADGVQDLAVLNRDERTVSLFLGDGQGGFVERARLSAGVVPIGLTTADLNFDEFPDLLIGNEFGDVLVLLNNGTVGFAPPARRADAVPLATADLNQDGFDDVLMANQIRDEMSVLIRQPGSDEFSEVFGDSGANQALLAPGDVVWQDLNGDSRLDALVASSGGNSVLVYHNGPGGLQAATSYFVGTNPRALSFRQLNGDDIPDLIVANQGSNDISILFGNTDANKLWFPTPGPRLRAGIGPSGVALRDVNIRARTRNPADPGLDGIPDLVVTNGSTGIVRAIPGVGNGFFNDGRSIQVDLGGAIVDLDGNFGLLADGRIQNFNLAAGTVATVFANAQGATALRSLAIPGAAFPVLFVAGDAGTVSALTSQDGLAFAVQDFQANATLDNPSALAILTDGTGRIEVYVTDAGEDGLAVLRFDAADLVTGLAPVNAGAPLALVATVVNSLLVDNGAEDSAASVNLLEVFAGIELAALSQLGDDAAIVAAFGAELLDEIVEAAESEAEVEPDPEATQPPTVQQFIAGMEEALRRLGWKVAEQNEEPSGWNWLDVGQEVFDHFMELLQRQEELPKAGDLPEPSGRLRLSDSPCGISLQNSTPPVPESLSRERPEEPNYWLPLLSSAVFATWLHRSGTRRRKGSFSRPL